VFWLYDGSFEGFLTALHRSYTHKCIPEVLTHEASKLNLLSEPVTIETDHDKARKVHNRITQHFPKKELDRIYHVFLCDDVPRERDLLIYIRMGFKDLKLLAALSHPVVFAIEGYQKRLFSTVHKMNEFLRFEMLEEGTLYAKIAPPRNVIPLLGRHFVKRLKSDHFIIHDIKRGVIAVWDGSSLEMHDVLEAIPPTLHKDEQKYQSLWKIFFNHVSIESRENLKQQRNFVPLLYRGLMTEFKTL
jgi:probable DNA metabolism protein